MSDKVAYLQAVGFVHSEIKSRSQAPKQAGANCPGARIHILPEFTPALKKLYIGQEINIFTWLHQAGRDGLTCHPQRNKNLPLHGVFATRSPNRPNPIGLHPCKITAIGKESLEVNTLEAIDGTPVIDIKPRLQSGAARPEFDHAIPPTQGELIMYIGREGWKKNLFNGFNGNISLRLQDRMLITATGCCKGRIQSSELVLMNIKSGEIYNQAQASSESPLHQAIYKIQPQAQAIVHTHPPHLLALESVTSQENILSLNLFEADVFRKKMSFAQALPPGTPELARSAAQAAQKGQIIILKQHGLVCWGQNAQEALGLSEEVEALARIQLLQNKIEL